MSLFGGMQIKETEAPAAAESDPDPPAASGFSFIKKDPVGEAAAPAPQPSGFNFIKKTDSTGDSDATPVAAETLAAPQAAPAAVKKKKRGARVKPGHDRDAQLGTMPMAIPPPAEPQPQAPGPVQSTQASPSTTRKEPAGQQSGGSQRNTASPSRAEKQTTVADPGPSSLDRKSSGTSKPPSQQRQGRFVPDVVPGRSADAGGSGGRTATKTGPPTESAVPLSLPPRPDGTIPGKDDGAAGIGSKMKRLFGFSSKGKVGSKEVGGSGGSRGSPHARPKVTQHTQAQSSPSRPQTTANWGKDRTSQPKRPPQQAQAPSRSGPPPAESGGPAVEPAAPAPENQVHREGREDTSEPQSDSNPDVQPEASQEVAAEAADSSDGASTEEILEEEYRGTAPPDDDDSLGLDGTVSSKSRAVIETASQEIAEAAEACSTLDSEQAALLQTVNAQLLASVSNRRLLTDKQHELEAAIASEDYDLAAAVEEQIAELKLSLQAEGSADRVALRASLLDLLAAKQEVWEKEGEIYGQTVELLQDLMHSQEEEVRAFELELEAATADEKAELATRQSQLNRKKGHLQLDKQHLDEQVARYRTLSDEKTVAFVKEKARLTTQQKAVRVRLEELRHELKRLETEDEDLTKTIAIQDERIQQAESGLSAEKKKVDAETKQIENAEADVDKKQEELDVAMARLDENTAGLRNQCAELAAALGAAREEMARAVKSKSEVAARASTLAKFMDERSVLFDPFAVLETEGDFEGKVVGLRKQAAQAAATVQALTSDVLAMQSKASALRKELEEHETRVPELERAKKLAVSGRNFKDAARIAAEMKELEAAREEQGLKLGELNATLLTQTEELEEAKKEHDVLQSELELSEKDFDVATFEALKAKSAELREEVEKYAPHSADVTALLKADATTCELVLEELSIKHGFEWSPPSESLDDLISKTISRFDENGNELLLIMDSPTPAPAPPTSSVSADLLGLGDMLGAPLLVDADTTEVTTNPEPIEENGDEVEGAAVVMHDQELDQDASEPLVTESQVDEIPEADSEPVSNEEAEVAAETAVDYRVIVEGALERCELLDAEVARITEDAAEKQAALDAAIAAEEFEECEKMQQDIDDLEARKETLEDQSARLTEQANLLAAASAEPGSQDECATLAQEISAIEAE